jgi:hypothetical protein
VEVALSSSISRHAEDMVFIMNHLGRALGEKALS